MGLSYSFPLCVLGFVVGVVFIFFSAKGNTDRKKIFREISASNIAEKSISGRLLGGLDKLAR